MKDYCVYCHTNRKNKKKYIGITCQKPECRWRHGEGYRNNKYFYRAIKKYGWENFDHIVLYDGLQKNEAECLEIKLIHNNKTTDINYGYNIEHGGNGTDKFNDETKKKISNALKGHICSEETRKKNI